ncbi:Receptor protein kinase [Musa troglodytarum]|uniref:Receptor protein kinase n=1 Tax=Musa troglodytarum TaxID=320322 RepID=A0A9E7FGQ1_9LILI|nr:Receptor protein kinase [Musa troglodytarum]
MADEVLELDEEARGSMGEVVDLTWHCTAREPHQRPDMSHAVSRLAPLVEPWRPSGREQEKVEDDDDGHACESLRQTIERWGERRGVTYTSVVISSCRLKVLLIPFHKH